MRLSVDLEGRFTGYLCPLGKCLVIRCRKRAPMFVFPDKEKGVGFPVAPLFKGSLISEYILTLVPLPTKGAKSLH